MARPVLTVVAVLVAVAVAIVSLAWAFQRRLIYLPYGEPPPAEAALPGAEEVAFTTADGLPLQAWFVTPDGAGDGTGVLVLPGNAGHRGLRADLAAALAADGLAVLLVDYRGFGGNPGAPSEDGLLFDAAAARAYLADRQEVDADRIVYFGESLGAAVAVRLALEEAPLAAVLRSPFTSLADVGRLHYPFLPVRALLRDRYPVTGQVRGVEQPVLVVAGERDGIVPADQSRAVADAASGPSRFVVIPDADHNDPELLAGDRLIGEVRAFLEDLRPPAGELSRARAGRAARARPR